jgi:phosphoenolpyruvate carboxylase
MIFAELFLMLIIILVAAEIFTNALETGAERIRRGIHISINGIAAGLRNTG